jgi:hypothetical protein
MRTALLVVFMRRVSNDGRIVVKFLLAPVVGFPTTYAFREVDTKVDAFVIAGS